MAPVTPPEHRARTRRWGRDGGKRRDRSRRTGDARKERTVAGFGADDAEKVVVPEPPLKKLKWFPSQIGEVFGSLCRVYCVDYMIEGHEDEVLAPDGNLDKGREGCVMAPDAAAPSSPVHVPGAVPLSSSTPPAASTVSAMFLAPATLLNQAPPLPPSSSSSQAPDHAPTRDKNKPEPLMLFSLSMHTPPPTAPHPTTHDPPAPSSRRAIALPPIPLPPPPQPDADNFERQESLKKQFSGLIAKSQEELGNFRRENLKRGRAAPVDEETLRRLAAVDAERKRFRTWIQMTVMEAKRGGGLFMHTAPREHVRALGIDAAMEGVVSPERPRGRDGKPIVLPEHPCSPLEKLGLFLKPLY